MTKDRLYIFDTTLRDGAQTAGIEFSLEDKISIVTLLEQIGVDYIEGGYPGANPIDTEFLSQQRTTRATFTAFGMTKRAGRSAANDPGVQGILNSRADAACFVAKTWDKQVEVALEISLDENLANLRETVLASIAAGKETLIDCEHFFDGFKANPDYALSCVKTAVDAGARWVVLCDTNGGTMPSEVRDIVAKVQSVAPGSKLGIHAHDDTGQAVANTLAAVEAGVRQIQGTLNGIGERCGNANLVTLIPTLVLKPAFADRLETGIDATRLARLTQIYTDDVVRISDEVLRYLHAIETQQIVPEREWEFGYFGQHHILTLPLDVIDPDVDPDLVPKHFEPQIKTLFQHAWSEAEHDLGYKPGSQPLERDQLRQLAYTSAQAWGADRVFNELFQARGGK
jgi:isopropylmalate/homocitrate/citramalate synthase